MLHPLDFLAVHFHPKIAESLSPKPPKDQSWVGTNANNLTMKNLTMKEIKVNHIPQSIFVLVPLITTRGRSTILQSTALQYQQTTC